MQQLTEGLGGASCPERQPDRHQWQRLRQLALRVTPLVPRAENHIPTLQLNFASMNTRHAEIRVWSAYGETKLVVVPGLKLLYPR